MITEPFADLAGWTDYLGKVDIPVLRRTKRELARLRQQEDSVNGKTLAAAVLQDPLLAVKVLAFIESQRKRSQSGDITTIDRAIMMLGISPFFRHFENLPVAEDHLQRLPEALLGLLRVVGRARRAAHYARDWALLRHDLDADEITVAALLHDIAETLLWCFAPELSLRASDLQRQNIGMRSQVAQAQVFGISALDLQLELARAWHLPGLLQTLMNDTQADHPRVRNVVYAVSLARHSADGWGDPALPDDFAAIAALLHLGVDQVMMRVGVDPYLGGGHDEPAGDRAAVMAGALSRARAENN